MRVSSQGYFRYWAGWLVKWKWATPIACSYILTSVLHRPKSYNLRDWQRNREILQSQLLLPSALLPFCRRCSSISLLEQEGAAGCTPSDLTPLLKLLIMELLNCSSWRRHMRRSHFYAPVLSFLYWFIPLQTSKQTTADTRILARTCLTLTVGANCCTWVPLFELCQPEQDYPCCRTPLELLDYPYRVSGLAADEGLSSEQPCCHCITTSSTRAPASRLLCPAGSSLCSSQGFISLWLGVQSGAKFNLYSKFQWRGI